MFDPVSCCSCQVAEITERRKATAITFSYASRTQRPQILFFFLLCAYLHVHVYIVYHKIKVSFKEPYIYGRLTYICIFQIIAPGN